MFLVVQNVGTKIHSFQMVLWAVIQPRKETEFKVTRITGFISHLIWADTAFAGKTKVNFSKMNHGLIFILSQIWFIALVYFSCLKTYIMGLLKNLNRSFLCPIPGQWLHTSLSSGIEIHFWLLFQKLL